MAADTTSCCPAKIRVDFTHHDGANYCERVPLTSAEKNEGAGEITGRCHVILMMFLVFEENDAGNGCALWLQRWDFDLRHIYGASRIGKQDAIDATIVGMLADPKEEYNNENEKSKSAESGLEKRKVNKDSLVVRGSWGQNNESGWGTERTETEAVWGSKKPEKETKKGFGVRFLGINRYLGVMNSEFLEVAFLGAVTRAQAKSDEIAKLVNENEHLKSLTNDKSFNNSEKDEITTQVMAEGEELSKKQVVQESTTRTNTITLETSSGGEPIACVRAYKSSSSKSDHISAIPGDQNCWKKPEGKDYNRPAQIIK
ncbi:hypothetical protein Tco_1403852 [Tanacetum coccineum]